MGRGAPRVPHLTSPEALERNIYLEALREAAAHSTKEVQPMGKGWSQVPHLIKPDALEKNIHLEALREAAAHSTPLSQARSAALYEFITGGDFHLFEMRKSILSAPYEGQPSSPELFHVRINEALERMRSDGGLTPDLIAGRGALTIIARYPDYINDALDLLSTFSLRAVDSHIPLTPKESQSIISSICFGESVPGIPAPSFAKRSSDLVLEMTLDAITQGRPLSIAHFWHETSSRFMSARELSSYIRPLSSSGFQHNWIDLEHEISRPLMFWRSLYTAVWEAPCRYPHPQLIFREVRSELEKQFRNAFLTATDISHISQWGCFRAHSPWVPSALAIHLALTKVLPHDMKGPEWPFNECFDNFTAAVSAQTGVNWHSKIPLPWTAALYRVYFDSQKVQRINNAPFQQMLLCAQHLSDDWPDRYPDLFTIVESKDPVAMLMKRQSEVALSLSSFSSLESMRDPVTTLLTAKLLGYEHTNYNSERSLVDVVSGFSADVASNLIEPLAPEWHERLSVVPRTRRLKESNTVSVVKEILDRRVNDYKRYRKIKSDLSQGDIPPDPEDARFLTTPIGVLLRELFSIDRYAEGLWRVSESSGTREAFLSLVELLAEACNGGIHDNVLCVRDSHFFGQLRRDLELDELLSAVRSEFDQHDRPENIASTTLEVAFKPTRGVLTEFVGHLCDTCFSRVSDLAKNSPWVTFVPFIKNPRATGRDGVFPAIAGGSLVIETDVIQEDGTPSRALLIRGYNPTSSLLKTVHVGALFDEFCRYLLDVAHARGISYIAVPEESSWGLTLSNRPYVYLDIERRFYQKDGAKRLTIASPEKVALNGLTIKTGVIVATTSDQKMPGA